MAHIDKDRQAAQEYLDAVRLAGTPSAHYRRDLDPCRPASMQPGSDLLPLFWIAFFALVIGAAVLL